MKMRELAAYAEKKFHIKELHLWENYPNVSVLAAPKSGKCLALLMKATDKASGQEVEICDIKCGQEVLAAEAGKPYLSGPFRLRNEKWAGVRFTEDTEPSVVFRMFDKAVEEEEARGYTIVLEDTPGRRDKTETFYENTPIHREKAAAGRGAASPSLEDTTIHRETVSPDQHGGMPGQQEYRSTRIPFRRDTTASQEGEDVPEQILKMQQLYRYGDGSFESKCRNFVKQGRFMENYEDDFPWDKVPDRYFITYHDLKPAQLRGYFTWRRRARKGSFENISSSYAYIYLYELLNGIGTSSVHESLEKMDEFETGFLDRGYGDERMRENLHRWKMELAIVKRLPAEEVQKYVPSEESEKSRPMMVLKDPGSYDDQEVYGALISAGNGKIASSIVFKKEKEEGTRLLAAMWRAALQKYQEEDGRDLFAALFGKEYQHRWYPLANTVYDSRDDSREDAEYEIGPCCRVLCMYGAWWREEYSRLYLDRKKLEGFLHEADRQMRLYLKTGYPLKEREEDAWAVPFITEVLEEDRKAKIEAARPKVTFHFESLAQIREDALVTQESLLTEEELQDERIEKAVPGTTEPEEAAPEKAATEMKAEPAEAPSQGDAKETAVPGSSLELREMHSLDNAQKNSGAGMETPGTGLPSPDAEFNSFSEDTLLTSQQREILSLLLQGKPAKGFIDSWHGMPEVIADEINEALWDEIGDSVLECRDGTLLLIEDYKDDVESILGEG